MPPPLPQALGILLDHGCNLKARDKEGRTALQWAAEFGSTEAFRRLLRDCDRQDVNAAAKNGFTALHLACANGQVRTGRTLEEDGGFRCWCFSPDLTATRDSVLWMRFSPDVLCSYLGIAVKTGLF